MRATLEMLCVVLWCLVACAACCAGGVVQGETESCTEYDQTVAAGDYTTALSCADNEVVTSGYCEGEEITESTVAGRNGWTCAFHVNTTAKISIRVCCLPEISDGGLPEAHQRLKMASEKP